MKKFTESWGHDSDTEKYCQSRLWLCGRAYIQLVKDSQLQITMIIVITVGDFTEPWNSPNIALGHYLAEFIKTLDPDSPRLMGRTTDAHQDKHCLCWTQIRSIGHSRVMQRVKWGRGWGVGGVLCCGRVRLIQIYLKDICMLFYASCSVKVTDLPHILLLFSWICLHIKIRKATTIPGWLHTSAFFRHDGCALLCASDRPHSGDFSKDLFHCIQ